MDTGAVRGAEITVRSGGSVEPALDFVAAAFEKATGHTVKITYRHDIEVCDVLVMPKETLERLFPRDGRIEQGAISIGRSVGLGVAVRLGVPMPDISSMDTFKQSVLNADCILLTDKHASCLYMESIFKKLGIYEQLEAKIQRCSIAQLLLDRLLSGKDNELMILSINAIRAYNDPRVVLVGPLPEEMQHRSEFFAVPMTASTNKEVAWDFVRFCAGPGKHLFVANGFN